MPNVPTQLRKLQKREIERLRDHFTLYTNLENPMKDQAFKTALQVGTRVDLPIGELTNPEMSGLLKVWLQTRALIYGNITSQHQFVAQGIEGLVSIEDVPLSMALLATVKTGLYRIEIFVPRTWKCALLQDSSHRLKGDGSSDNEKQDQRDGKSITVFKIVRREGLPLFNIC